jgi:hypothetical protein
MSSSISDIKKLVKYQSKLAGEKGDYTKQKLYNEKIAEYTTKIKNKGIDISKILKGGADEEDLALTKLKESFAAVKLKAALPVGDVLKKVESINKFAADAQIEHKKLIEKFVAEIKKLHSDKDTAVDILNRDHVAYVKTLDDKIAALNTELAALKALSNTSTQDAVTIATRDATIKTITEQLASLTALKNDSEKKLTTTVAQYNSYKAFAEKELELLSGEIGTLKSNSESVIKTLNAIVVPSVDDAIKITFPKILIDVLFEEIIELLTKKNSKLPIDVASVDVKLNEKIKELKDKTKFNDAKIMDEFKIRIKEEQLRMQIIATYKVLLGQKK